MPINTETKKYRKENNLCEKCGTENAPGRKLCRKHLDAAAARGKAKRTRRKTSGTCVDCGGTVDDGFSACPQCRSNNAERARRSGKTYYQKNKEAGRCSCCSDDVAPGKTMCQKHLDEKTAKQAKKRAERKVSGLCPVCGKDKPESGKKTCAKCLKRINEWYSSSEYKERYKEVRKQQYDIVIAYYGGKCNNCGEQNPLALTLDHINNDGNQHRKRLNKYGSGFYKWVIDNDFPDDLQLLCANCNLMKHRNGGVCPHQEHENKLLGVES